MFVVRGAKGALSKLYIAVFQLQSMRTMPKSGKFNRDQLVVKN